MFVPRSIVLVGVLAACTPARGSVVEPDAEAPMPSYEDAMRAIARDIQQLRSKYPQLRGFSVAKHFDAAQLSIGYAFHTHPPQRAGGWAAAVPNPDPDGIWLHVDFHDPDSTAQIHTQPVVPPMHFRDKKVMFLILEGEETESVAAAVRDVLRAHGVSDGPP